MWHKASERARHILICAQGEAIGLGDECLHTEHILLGITQDGDSLATQILEQAGISRSHILDELNRESASKDVEECPDLYIELTPRVQRIAHLAFDEARQLNQSHFEAEHILLALIRVGGGKAAQILQKLGIELKHTRKLIADSKKH